MKFILNKIRADLLLAIGVVLAASPLVAAGTNQPAHLQPAAPAPAWHQNIPEMIEADGRLRLNFGEEHMVIPRGLQPSMLRTASGALVVQAQLPQKPFPTSRMVYPSALETRISRDDGATWTVLPLKPGENGLNMEGGAVQLRDGMILALDTYITPGPRPDEGIGQLYTSTNDWRTLAGPKDVRFALPGVVFIVQRMMAAIRTMRSACIAGFSNCPPEIYSPHSTGSSKETKPLPLTCPA